MHCDLPPIEQVALGMPCTPIRTVAAVSYDLRGVTSESNASQASHMAQKAALHSIAQQNVEICGSPAEPGAALKRCAHMFCKSRRMLSAPGAAAYIQ